MKKKISEHVQTIDFYLCEWMQGQVVSFSQQVSYFVSVKENIERQLGVEKAKSLISKSLFYIAIGSNDYVANYYFLDPIKTPLEYQYSPPEYLELLLSNLQDRIVVTIYSLNILFEHIHQVKSQIFDILHV